MDSKLKSEFEAAARPLMQWLCENVHPHHVATVTPITAQLSELKCSSGPIFNYVKS